MQALHFLIIHGTMGSPEVNWFPWLKSELEARGHLVLVPRFPTPENQNYVSWREVALAALAGLDPAHTVLIGHSMGAAFSFRLAEETTVPYKAIYAVAPFIDKIGLPEFDPLIATFVEHDFDWDKIKKNAGHIHLLAGDNDPYVSHALTQRVEDALGVPITYIANGAHLNADAGYTSFPLLLESILSA